MKNLSHTAYLIIKSVETIRTSEEKYFEATRTPMRQEQLITLGVRRLRKVSEIYLQNSMSTDVDVMIMMAFRGNLSL